jgi:hypothetical protein
MPFGSASSADHGTNDLHKETLASSETIVPTTADTANKWHTLASMKLYVAWVLWISLGAVTYGFDLAIYTNLLAFQSFAQRYGAFDAVAHSYIIPARTQAVWNASSSASQIIGGLSAGYLMNKIGRR